MDQSWLALVTAVLAGGFLNQVFTALFADRIQFRRDYNTWKRNELYSLYSQLLDITSSSSPSIGLDQWPSTIRSLSQRIYLLYKGGKPPQDLCDSLEEVFQLSVKARDNLIQGSDLKEELRKSGSQLRRRLAKSLENHS